MALKLVTLSDDARSMQLTRSVRKAQRLRFEPAKLVLVLISGVALVVALVAASPSPARIHAGAAAETAHVYTVPASVNGTCKHDVTYAFGNWLLSIPNGTPGHDSVVKLNKGA